MWSIATNLLNSQGVTIPYFKFIVLGVVPLYFGELAAILICYFFVIYFLFRLFPCKPVLKQSSLLQINIYAYKIFKNFSNRLKTCSFQIKINDSCFQRTTCAKYLGVLIDSSLDWSSHVQHITSKLVKASFLFYKIRNVVSVDVLRRYILVLCIVI